MLCHERGYVFFDAEMVWACVGARVGVGAWARACLGVGAGVSMFSRVNRVCRVTNRYEGSVNGKYSFRLFIPSEPVSK